MRNLRMIFLALYPSVIWANEGKTAKYIFQNDIKGQNDKNDIGTKKRLEVKLINGWILN